MTKGLIVTGAVVIVVMLLLVFARRSRSAGQPDSRAQETYLGLRNLMLTGSRTKFSLPPTSRPTEPWGVLMDWGVPAGKASVVAMSDGSASIYLSNGGGYLGGIGQEPIRAAAKKAVEAAAEVQPQMKKTETFTPLPDTGEVTFYALTDAGVYTTSAKEADLREGKTSFAKLGNAMQQVVTEYRIFQGKNPAPKQ